MNRERRLLPATSDHLLTADAKKPASDFYGAGRSLFTPAPSRTSESAAVARLYLGRIFAAALKGEPVEAIRAEMNAELEAVDARYQVERDLRFTMEMQRKQA